ncbi:Rtc5p [Sugiyamaella lignohabitans]|uniref:Restriction of telomere capping protein 5 n=1 Tax=Sugiyamaella lignohabitans TaxID=796027 RepID=A0A167FD58_9ASCO|nr:Rtc5p [Sugiyamaella lignohabitans]ANB15144.1 Rtc5p [Sugiyamaella lignohabitans]
MTVENLVKALTFYNGKYKGVIRGEYDILKLLFLSFATEIMEGSSAEGQANIADEQIEFERTGISSWDRFSVVQSFDNIDVTKWYISGPDLVALFSLLLPLVDYKPYESFDAVVERFEEASVKKLRKSAQSMVRSISADSNSKLIEDITISCEEFREAILLAFPHVLEPLALIFDRLLYQQKSSTVPERRLSSSPESPVQPEDVDTTKVKEPEKTVNSRIGLVTKLTTYAIRGQLYSTFGPMIQTMVKLYSGSEAGFSMRSFETKVFNWNAPSIFLISGRRVADATDIKANSRIRSFNDQIPPVRAKNNRKSKTVIFGAFVESPWRANSKECFGNESTVLTQLFPTHNVYKASKTNRHYAYFSRGEGIGFGSPPPRNGKYSNIGNISLVIESSFEFGVFRHFGPGGSFEPGPSPSEKILEFEDRFVIEEIEVWGCGTEEHLAEQKLRWEWEEREAQNRRKINVDSLGEDRALLEMAGLVGKYSQSGGSV